MESLAREITKDDLKRAPYFDQFDPEKEYTKALYKGDKPLLGQELNEVQSIQSYHLGNLGNSIMEDGDIQSGMDFVMGDDHTLTVKYGIVYANGKVRRFNEQTIQLDGEGMEYVGVDVRTEVVTYEDDEDLLDKTSGLPSSFSDASDRLRETVFLTKGDESLPNVIYQFEDGDLYVNTDRPNYTEINQVLAERTYDESGSYRVNGFDTYTEEHPDDDSKIQLVIDKGRAYILGYKVDKGSTTRIALDKALDTRQINNEGFYYDDTDRKNSLGNNPVKTVDRVTAQVEVVKETVSRGVQSGGTDYLENTSVTSVKSVWTNDYEYTQGDDFQLEAGQAISWAPNGQEPSAGSTYYVTYIYNKRMVENTDYTVDVQGDDDDKIWWINFEDSNGSKPVDQSLVNVDYTFYLARKDLIVLDHNGKFTIHKGQPDSLRVVEKPNHQDPLTLPMATVTVMPNSDTAYTNLFSVTRQTMRDLQKFANRVENIEYNQAVFYFDQEAIANENPIYLRGVFSDSFISLDKADTTHPDATASFDFDTAEITLPWEQINKKKPEIIEDISQAHVWGRLVTAPFDEVVGIDQPYATEAKNVNPYNVFNKQGVLKLNPSEDNWIEEENITVTDQKTETRRIKRWWRHQGADWAEDEINSVSNIQLDEGQAWGNQDRTAGEGYRYDRKYGRTGTKLTSGGQRTKEEMIEFMRQIDVKFEAENLTPNANNLRLTFDGLTVPVIPSSGYKKGAQTGTGMANPDGTFKGVFKVPAGVRCGTREVNLQNNDNLASTSYTAQGTKKVIEDVIIRTRVTVNLYDPLAQSFTFQTNRVISSIDAYFGSKDPNTNIICQIRGLSEGGQPNRTIYAERVLKPEDINTSGDGSAPTNITFDDPLMCKAGQTYCMVFITESDAYTMWIATMGQNRLDNPSKTITSNPYLQGVMFSSSNAQTWTEHQRSDLKFTIYTAQFNDTAVLEFDTMEDIRGDQFILMSTYLTPANTACFWQAKIVMDDEPENATVADKKWQPISNYVDVDAEDVIREAKMKATFNANIYLSPMLSLNDIMFTSFLTALEGSYVTKTLDMSEAPFNHLHLSLEEFLPRGTEIKVRYSTDEGKTWKEFSEQPEVQEAGGGFIRVIYDEFIEEGTATEKFAKFRIDMTSQQSFLRPRARAFMVNMTDK